MKLLNVLLLGGAGLFILNRLSAASVASTLNFRIGSIGMEGSNLIIDLIAQNPQNAGFVVNSVVADLLIDGKAVGNISMFDAKEVKALGETKIPLLFRFSLAGVLQNVKALIDGSLGRDAVIAIIGNVNVNGTVMPLNLSIKKS